MEIVMKRPLKALAVSVLLAGVGGCQRSSAPLSTPPAGEAAPAATAPAPPPPAASNPGGGPFPAPPPEAAVTPQPAAVPVKPMPAELPAILATVNGEQVLRWELETALRQAEDASGGPVPAAQRDSALRGLLDELITTRMLAQEARNRKIGVSEAEVDAEMAGIRKSFPTEESFQQALLLQGVTADQLRQVTRLGMQARKIIDAEITAKVSIQDTEVDSFYKQNIDRFKQGDSIRASHIYIQVAPDAPATAKNQARAAAQELVKQIRAGGDFAKLARENSSDTNSAPNGGDLGFFERGALPPDFEAIAFNMKPGTTSDVVELQTGLHIIRVTDARGPRTAPLAEVRDNLKQFLLDGQRQTKLDELIGQLKAKSRIEVLV
jgi:peptidyl-prolyl cis-trans isomerase C